MHTVGLTQEREITPYLWVHPEEETACVQSVRRRVFLATKRNLLRCSPVMMAKRRNWETGSRV